jgi:DNA-binding NarL/FixJ family response regulator
VGDRIKVVLVDDNKAFLEGLEALLENDGKFDIIGKFISGLELLRFEKLDSADLLLLDVEMPVMNGIQTAKLVNYDFPQMKMIAITMYQDKVYLNQLIESGFKGFVNKADVSDQLFSTIEEIMKGELSFPRNIN